MRKVLALAALAIVVAGCDKESGGEVRVVDRANCTADTVITGVEYRPLRKSELYQGRDLSGPKIINEKATKLLGEVSYKSIDSSTRVFEECTHEGSAFVRIVDPEWLREDKGWVPESVLKERLDSNNKYEGLISAYLFEDLPPGFFEGKNAKFKPAAKNLLKYQVEAAKKAVDSGSCDHVDGVLFIAGESSLTNFKYIVDCSNKKRFEFSSADIDRAGFNAVSNSDKALGKDQAMKSCKSMIERNVVNPGTLKFHDLMDVSYYKAETTGGERLVLGFEAKNKLGHTQGYRATCLFSVSGKAEIELSQK